MKLQKDKSISATTRFRLAQHRRYLRKTEGRWQEWLQRAFPPQTLEEKYGAARVALARYLVHKDKEDQREQQQTRSATPGLDAPTTAAVEVEAADSPGTKIA